ncbi:hypothetical protein PACTADRAFT_32788 [Pachysolen tannophilus NRRL Y-2460]|uniref:Spc7 kinetochore protein domain-containing protein n=1 Tax=Pachysolen tannophilus NRRL Y-2460 TaxID=669874 RepID=A0A1E4TZZ0_PACTA|nr:hypothetical protein PACTADRAFT_32788 [Pachysolen tannophilus NRRL Y-2460]
MVSAPSSPNKKLFFDADSKENIELNKNNNNINNNNNNNNKKKIVSRRHTLAPSKSILKSRNAISLNAEEDDDGKRGGFSADNHTITIMQKVGPRESLGSSSNYNNKKQTKNKRRVSFAPEVTLHKINTLPSHYFEALPKQREPRRRDSVHFIPPFINKDADEDDEKEDDDGGKEMLTDSSDMEIDDDDDDNNDNTATTQVSTNFVGRNSKIKEPEFTIYQDNDDDIENEATMDVTTNIGSIKNVNHSHEEEIEGNDTVGGDSTMDLTTNYGQVKTTIQSEIGSEEVAMDLTTHHGQIQIFENTNRIIEKSMDMEITENISMPKETTTKKESIIENSSSHETNGSIEISISQDSQDSEQQPFATSTQTQVEKSQQSSMEGESQEENDDISMDLTTVYPSVRKLSEIAEMSEPEDEEMHKKETENATAAKLIRNNAGDENLNQVENQENNDLVGVFGDPTLMLDLLRVTGGSSDLDHNENFNNKDFSTAPLSDASKLTDKYQETSENNKELSDIDPFVSSAPIMLPTTLPQSPHHRTSSKRLSNCTPRKSLQGTNDNGSPNERSSSNKKRKVSVTSPEIPSISNTEEPSPSINKLHSIQAVPNVEADKIDETEKDQLGKSEKPHSAPATPSKSFSVSPRQLNLKEMVNSLTPKRRQKESFTHIAKQMSSPRRRRSLSDITISGLTPLRAAKKNSLTPNKISKEEEVLYGSSRQKKPLLDLQQAVVTTTVSLTGSDGSDGFDDSQDIEDVSDDYVPVALNTFLDTVDIKFHDDLDVKDDFNDSKFICKNGNENLHLSDYVVALQKLKFFELTDFSCKELKKNIVEGKELFEKLEKEILEENPPLIREYMESSETVQSTMNQAFQILKNYAREQAKSVWYGWRSQLIEGVYQGLIKNKRAFEDDKLKVESKLKALKEQYDDLLRRKNETRARLEDLIKDKEEFASCDKEELLRVRKEVIAITDLCLSKKRELVSLNEELTQLEEQLKLKTQMLEDLSIEVEDIAANINYNKVYKSEEVDLLEHKFKLIQSITGFKYVAYDKENCMLQMSLDTIQFEINLNDLKDINSIKIICIDGLASPIISRFSTRLTKLISFKDVPSYLQSFKKLYNNLLKLDKQLWLINLQTPITYIDNDDDEDFIVLRLKIVDKSCKKYIKFVLSLDMLLADNIVIKRENLEIKTIYYNEGKDGSSKEQTDEIINQLKTACDAVHIFE